MLAEYSPPQSTAFTRVNSTPPIMEPLSAVRKRGRTPDLAVLTTTEARPSFFVETGTGEFRETWFDPRSLENAPRKSRRLHDESQEEKREDPLAELSVLEKLQFAMTNDQTKGVSTERINRFFDIDYWDGLPPHVRDQIDTNVTPPTTVPEVVEGRQYGLTQDEQSGDLDDRIPLV